MKILTVSFLGCLLPMLALDAIWLTAMVDRFQRAKVSGIPMLEKKQRTNPGFAEYEKKTPAFFPWPRTGRGS